MSSRSYYPIWSHEEVTEGNIRLVILHNGLLDVNPDDFDLTSWKSLNPCGTIACAIGHGCTMPDLKSRGLRAGPSGIPIYGNLTNWPAVAACFRITEGEARWLFQADSYNEYKGTEALVLVRQRIRLFVDLRSTDEEILDFRF